MCPFINCNGHTMSAMQEMMNTSGTTARIIARCKLTYGSLFMKYAFTVLIWVGEACAHSNHVKELYHLTSQNHMDVNMGI